MPSSVLALEPEGEMSGRAGAGAVGAGDGVGTAGVGVGAGAGVFWIGDGGRCGAGIAGG